MSTSWPGSYTATVSPIEKPAVAYRIHRKGSRYNILSARGREFTKYQSARVAGPRWEELTGTPWPFESTAYEPGLRLWQLGAIRREEVGARTKPVAKEVESGPITCPTTFGALLDPDHALLALPAPRIDVEAQRRAMQRLRSDPRLVFAPETRVILQREIEYNLPQARWAQTLLRLLIVFEKRRRSIHERVATDPKSVLDQHVAWQRERLVATAAH